MRIFNGFEELRAAVGTEVGVSDWIEVTQDRISRFADATCDEQWIHVDQERAKAEMPGGKTSTILGLPVIVATCWSNQIDSIHALATDQQG